LPLPAPATGPAATPSEFNVKLTVTGPENAAVGEPVVFAIEVVNNGSTAVNGLVLRDHLPSGLKHPQGDQIEADLGTLAPRQTRQIALTTTAVQPGRQVNKALIALDDAVKAEAQATVLVAGAGLVIRQTGPAHSLPDRTVDYVLEVSNPGKKDAPDVRVQDVLPAGLEFVAASEGGRYDPAVRTVNWQLPCVAAGQKRDVLVKLRAKTAGDLVNRVLAQAKDGEQGQGETVIRVGGLPALRLEITGRDSQVEVGAETVYEVRLANQGSGPSTGVQLQAIIPVAMQALSAEGPAAYRIQAGQLVFEPLPKLEPGAEARFRIHVRCQTPGDWRFQVQMTSEQSRLPLCKEEGTRVYK
jgi:uncharacterized repeat protein (TIGR01451 family)